MGVSLGLVCISGGVPGLRGAKNRNPQFHNPPCSLQRPHPPTCSAYSAHRRSQSPIPYSPPSYTRVSSKKVRGFGRTVSGSPLPRSSTAIWHVLSSADQKRPQNQTINFKGRERGGGAHSEGSLSANPYSVRERFGILKVSRIVPAFFGYRFF